MQANRTPSTQIISSRSEAGRVSLPDARQPAAFRLSTFKARSVAAVAATAISATTLGGVLTLYGSAESSDLIALGVRPVPRHADDTTHGPRLPIAVAFVPRTAPGQVPSTGWRLFIPRPPRCELKPSPCV